ncbi:hypothetical protein KL86APRO_11367 [uncultured Alphaproteobacteria bacterium]|uniref:Uncharacterized protein n=1 Tax=uncultured Alphaproteobacteria bacterium TaxID=91750 RepID=A0A212JNL1_9PROT|nr:hypothetical protein KL86APRO_11367 [uncultured Alphaproteobacteria bacterium]
MADFPFFRHGNSIEDALVDASDALETLSLLISTSNMDFAKDTRHGLCVMLDAVNSVMATAASLYSEENSTSQEANSSGLEQVYRAGFDAGRLDVCRSNVVAGTEARGELEGVYRSGYGDGAKAGWASGWYAGRGKVEAFNHSRRDEDVQALMSPMPGIGGGEVCPETVERPQHTDPIPRLTEEAPATTGNQSQASA